MLVAIIILFLARLLLKRNGEEDNIGMNNKNEEYVQDSLQAPSETENAVEISSPLLYEVGIPDNGQFSINDYDTTLAGLDFFTTIDSIPYTLLEGRKFFQGDIIIANKKEFDSTSAVRNETFLKKITEKVAHRQRITKPERNQIKAVGEKALGRRWEKGIVYYAIDPNIQSEENTVLAAINLWTSQLPTIQFKKVNPRVDDVKNYVVFEGSDGYASDVGMVGRKQSLYIKSPAEIGNVAHEIGHLLGLWHEQSHPDRDNFITVHLNNLKDLGDPKKNENLKAQFMKIPASNVVVTDYDFRSLMHYPMNAFAIPGKVTIELKPPYSTSYSDVGQRVGPSALDIQQIKKIYN